MYNIKAWILQGLKKSIYRILSRPYYKTNDELNNVSTINCCGKLFLLYKKHYMLKFIHQVLECTYDEAIKCVEFCSECISHRHIKSMEIFLCFYLNSQ